MPAHGGLLRAKGDSVLDQSKKKLFLSSTCYDFRHIRGQIEKWATGAGYRPLLSDRATFPVDPGRHRHDVCIANAKMADLFVLLVGSRTGAPYYADTSISITRAEYRAAVDSRVKMVIFVDEEIWNERNAYRADRTVELQATSDPAVFDFIDELQRAPSGHWFQIFSSDKDIIDHLANLTELFSVVPSGSKKLRYGKNCLYTDSLSSEARRHISIIYGNMDKVGDYELWDSYERIPEVVREQSEIECGLDGFTIYAERVDENRYLVRATDLGQRVRQELYNAWMSL